MTQEDIAERIVLQGNCTGISCNGHHCQFLERSCESNSQVYSMAKEWLESHGGTTNKNEAIKRLDAIEKEQAELRKIIEKGDKIVYDISKLYVGILNGCPYIMVGKGGSKEHFNMHSLDNGVPTCMTYTDDSDRGQECIDAHIERGFTIHVFDDTKKALQFFIDHL